MLPISFVSQPASADPLESSRGYPSVHRVLLTPALYAVNSFSPTSPPKTVRSVETRLYVLFAVLTTFM